MPSPNFHNRLKRLSILPALMLLANLPAHTAAQSEKPQANSGPPSAQQAPAATHASSLIPLTPDGTVQIDREGGRVLIHSEVVLQAGVLEMLCCRKLTKEHESILMFDAPAYVIHAGLLVIGAEPGQPVQYAPQYKPATGPGIDIHLSWTDLEGQPQRVRAQEWIRHATRRYHVAKLERLPSGLTLPIDSELKYDPKTRELYYYGQISEDERDALLKLSSDKQFRQLIQKFYAEGQTRPMKANWIFTGSRFAVDPETGQRVYLAEGGEVVCVANFSTAMIDVDVESQSTGTDSLLFEAWEERIPPLGTPVVIELSLAKPAEPKDSDELKNSARPFETNHLSARNAAAGEGLTTVESRLASGSPHLPRGVRASR